MVVGLAAVPLVVAGCSDGFKALDTHTAQVRINGSDTGDRLRVRCTQVQWVWFIESLQEAPGFRAQVSTGDSVDARLIRLDDVGGFTGSAWKDSGTEIGADAEFADGAFTITGTATGFFQKDPSATTTAQFEIQTDC